MAEKSIITKDSPPDVIERDIASTREKLSETIDQIQERFSVEHWRAVVGQTIREKAKIAASWGKEVSGRAGESALRFGRAARESALEAKDRMVEIIRNDPTAAGVIAFELGVLAIIAYESLRKRKTRIMRERGAADYAKVKILSIEEVEQKVKKAALTPEEEARKAA